MPESVEIREGDIVQIQRVELYYARVEPAGARGVVIQPLDPRIADRRVRIAEIKRVFREVGPPAAAPARVAHAPAIRRR